MINSLQMLSPCLILVLSLLSAVDFGSALISTLTSYHSRVSCSHIWQQYPLRPPNIPLSRCTAKEQSGSSDTSHPPTLHLKSRRDFLVPSAATIATAAFTILLNVDDVALAADLDEVEQQQQEQQQRKSSRRPYAPTVEALVPATHVRALLHKASSLTTTWIQTGSNDADDGALQQLRDVMLLEDGSAPKTKRPPLRKEGPYQDQQRIGAEPLLVSKLSGSAVRSAFNVYTANLRFGENYVLTASPAERKQLIRNDALPDVKTVITADLDLRDLYRNQIQTAVDDAGAELSLPRPDPQEVQQLMSEAMSAMDAWFALIDDFDVQTAESKRKQQQQEQDFLLLPNTTDMT